MLGPCVTLWFHMLFSQCLECLILMLNWLTGNEIVYGKTFELSVEQ